MVISGFGLSIAQVGTPETTTSANPFGTRSDGVISAFDSISGNDQVSNEQLDIVQEKESPYTTVYNEKAFERTDMLPVPHSMGYDSATGQAWDAEGRPLNIDPAMAPIDDEITFTAEPIIDDQTEPPSPMVGDIDLGGPYTGYQEGDDVVFTAVVSDPLLVKFRWDLNLDGEWDDCAEQAAGTNGWTDTDVCTYHFEDDHWGEALVEAWDGTSTYTVSYTGWGLGSPSPTWYMYYYITYWTLGHKFKAKVDMTIDRMRFYRYSSSYNYGREVTLWDAATQAKMAECNPPSGSGYRQCNIPTTTMYAGHEYVISMRLGGGYYGYWYARGIDWPADTDYADWMDVYYAAFTTVPVFPDILWSGAPMPLIDFYYSYDVLFELVDDWDTAHVEVENVAPYVYDLSVNPANVLEGNEAEFNGWFDDPGLADKWQYRWCWGDGTCDSWGAIKVGSGITRMESILVYSDVAPHYIVNALDFFGVSYTFTTDIYSIEGLIRSQQWELIIYQSYYIAYVAPVVEDAMMDQVPGGALLMYNNWYANNRNSHPIMEYFGAQCMTSLTTPITMYSWDNSHDMFNIILTVPYQMDPTHNQYWTDGFRLQIKDHAHAPMGYTTTEQANQGAIAIRNDYMAIFDSFTPQNYQGDQDSDGDVDTIELLVNQLRLLAGPEVAPTMPWPVPPATHVYRDDHPATGTPFDDVTATLEVKDDDHGRLMGGTIEDVTDFESGTPWPAGWSETCGFAWQRGAGYLSGQSALWWYYYDWTEQWHCLESRSYDLSMVDMTAPMQVIEVSYDYDWEANWPYGYQDGYVDITYDGGGTWTTIAEYHHNDPSSESGTFTLDITSEAAGKTDVRVMFRIQGYDDWWWHVDNVVMYATWGTPIDGLGSDTIPITVNNVEPVAYGVPTITEVGEALDFYFDGITIEDPTMYYPPGVWNPVSTESYMYRWNFDDGIISPWYNKGSLEVPKLKVLLLHTLYYGTGDQFIAMLRSIDLIDQVDVVEWLYLSAGDVPTVTEMLGYDAVIVATNYARIAADFDLTRRTIGDRLADYMDAGGAVITFMFTYDLSPYYGDLFGLLGRYMDEDYGAWEWTQYDFDAASLGEVHLEDPTCAKLMEDVNSLSTPLVSPGAYPLTPGAEQCAEWEDGGGAVAYKLAGSGMSVNIGSFSGSGSSVCGGDCATLIRNAVTVTSGAVVPDNIIPTEVHVYGDNGIYDVDLMIVDDDMGWDISGSEPVPIPGMTQTMSHNVMSIEVMNRDPVIQPHSIELFLAAKMCLRVTGGEWNTVSLDWFVDGTLNGGVSVTRHPGDPNDQAKCGYTKIDLLSPHTFEAKMTFEPFPGETHGSNPAWLIIEPWRGPTTPGHGTIVFKEEFQVADPPSTYVREFPVDNLKRQLFDSGRGAPVDIQVIAADPGTDDIAFYYEYSDGSTPDINIHANAGGILTGHIADPKYLGFDEPYFDRAANDVRTPFGTQGFTVQDSQHHRFTGTSPFLWVCIIVLDDDNSRGYVSPFDHDGTDMEFVVLDLT